MTKNVIQSYLDASFDHEGQSVQVSMTQEEHIALFDRIQKQWTRYGDSAHEADISTFPKASTGGH